MKRKIDSEAPRRQRLPDRRYNANISLEHGGQLFTASIGFDARARPRELFITGAKAGSDMAAILNDASVVISIALQNGIEPEALAASVAHRENHPRVRTSILGKAIDVIIAETKRSETDGSRRTHGR